MTNPSEAPTGAVESQFFTYGSAAEPVRLQGGQTLESVTLAYETYGQLNPARDNAILLFHALTGSQHAAGYNQAIEGVDELWTEECRVGWWDGFIGPGKALDTERYCVICANYLGGCYGSTGPRSIDPASGRPYGARFPHITLSDMVDTQVELLRHLGISQLHAVIGASVGGMMCLSLATRYPQLVNIVIPIASAIAVTPLQSLHNFEQIYAIERDPHFNGGDYYGGPLPDEGLALARIIGHKTFVSVNTLKDRARLEVLEAEEHFSWYPINNTLESYMLHQGRKFVNRFDANSYLRFIEAWQRFNLGREAGGVHNLDELFARCRQQRYLVFSIDSDVCFYPEDQKELVRVLKQAGIASMRITVHSEKGHDSFLVEPELFTPHLVYSLNSD